MRKQRVAWIGGRQTGAIFGHRPMKCRFEPCEFWFGACEQRPLGLAAALDRLPDRHGRMAVQLGQERGQFFALAFVQR